MKTPFRDDINGLRAIAVISVLLFHFSHSLLSGGFVGVDIFFVISGFLMTSIIVKGLENNTFSLWAFFKARITRIVPALLCIVFLLLVVGFLFFEPLTYQLIGKHSADSLLFISNYTYKNEAGYFDADAYSKFLLHTWSLSVEWQFYIIYPILLLALKKTFNPSTAVLKKIILTLCIIFFIYAVFVSFKRPTSAYFMLYARAWELLAGACVFLYPLRGVENRRKYLELLGLALIILSFFVIDSHTKWPGYMALLPIIGTSLCLLAHNKKSIFANIIFRKIGLWSYAIYLIHWPLLVFCKKLNIALPLVAYLLISIFFAFIMHELIEKRRHYKYGFIAFYIITLTLAFYVSHDGIKERISDKRYQLTQQEFHKSYYGGVGYNGESLQYLNADQNTFKTLFYGDSLAWQYAKYIDESKHPAVTFFQNSCFSLPNAYVTALDKEKCKHQFTAVKQFIANQQDKNIVIAQSWAAHKLTWFSQKDDPIKFKDIKSYEDFLKQELTLFIKEMGDNKQYFIIGRTVSREAEDTFICLARHNLPIYSLLNTQCLLKQAITGQEDVLEINNFLDNFAKQHNNVHFIDPNKALCKNGQCLLMVNGEPIYSDQYHLSVYGTELVGKYIMDIIQRNQQPD